MSKASMRARLRDRGLGYSIAYYWNRIWSTLFGRVVLLWIRIAKPVSKKKILVFKNRKGQDYTGNCQAFFEYLLGLTRANQYEFVYCISERRNGRMVREHANRLLSQSTQGNGDKPPVVRIVLAECDNGWTSPRAYYDAYMASYFFYTHNTARLNRYRNPNQRVVNLWHGCGYKANLGVTTDTKGMGFFDMALVPGPAFVATKSQYWNCPESKILPIGYPSYDWMLQAKVDRSAFMEAVGFHELSDCKLVLWVPTFRNTAETYGFAENSIQTAYGIPLANSIEELTYMNQVCEKKNILLLVKKHPMQTIWSDISMSHIRFVTDRELTAFNASIYHVLGCADALLSDYSSLAIDYLLLDRPIGYVLSDYEEYQDKRGFVFTEPLAYMPGEKIYSLSDWETFMEHVTCGEDPFRASRAGLLAQVHNRTESYCERIAKKLSL